MKGDKWGEPIIFTNCKWQYYIVKKFAFMPMYIQGKIVWLKNYWLTWPVDQFGRDVTMYLSIYADDPGPGPAGKRPMT